MSDPSFNITDAADTLLPRYDYEFYVWPHEAAKLCRETIDLLYENQLRQVKTFNEKEWGVYRARVEQDGVTFREIERKPYVDPEVVL